MKNILISFSGGLTSAFMTYHLIRKYKDANILIVFSNTGKERNETLDFIKQCAENWNLDIHWIEYMRREKHGFKNWFKVVDYETASRNGEPFERYIKVFGRLPNAGVPDCSKYLKQYTIHKYAKQHFGTKDYHTAIGIRWDEKHRINWAYAKEKKYFYPLVTEFATTKEFVHKFWRTQSFTLNLKSYEGNCDCCWKKSKRKLYTIAKENPQLFDWWVKMGKKYGADGNFYRKQQSATDILNDAKDFPDSKMSKCDTEISKDKDRQMSFFDGLDTEMSCNCEA